MKTCGCKALVAQLVSFCPSNWRLWVQIQIWKFTFLFSPFFHQEGMALARLDFSWGKHWFIVCPS